MKRRIVVESCAGILAVALVAWLAYGLEPASGAAREPAVALVSMPAVVSNGQSLRLTPAGHVGGDATAVAVQGSFAYAGFGFDFSVLDIADPAHPARLGNLLLGNGISKIVVRGPRAYALAGNQLDIIDVTSPNFPSLIGEHKALTDTMSFVVSGTLAYVTERDGLHIVDVENPAQPEEIGFLPVTSPNPWWYISAPAVQGHFVYMFVSTDTIQIWAVDVSNPRAPIKVGSAGAGIVSDMTIAGDYAYAVGTGAGYPVAAQLWVISLVKPTAPSVVKIVSVSYAYGQAITVDGTYAYVGTGSHFVGLLIFDISNPLTPTLKTGMGGFSGSAISSAGHDLFIAAESHGLLVADVTVPMSPTIIAGYATAGNVNGVASLGSNLYAAQSGDGDNFSDTEFGGMSVVTVTASGGLVPARNVASEDGHAIAAANGYAYLATENCGRRYSIVWRNFRVYSLADPSSPVETGGTSLSTGYPCNRGAEIHMAISGTYAYVTLEYQDFEVINTAQPTAPAVIASYTVTNGHYYGIGLSGSYAYVACGEAGLRVLDVSNPAAPVEVGMLAAADSTRDVVVRGNYAYIADGAAGLRIADISNPTAPFAVGSVDTPGFAQGIALRDQYAFVADGGAGVRMIDVSDPFAPSEVSAFDTPGNAVNVTVGGDSIYVADGVAGVWRLVVTTHDVFLPLTSR